MIEKMTLEELTDKVNSAMQIDGYQSLDKRHKELTTGRRIRDYISKGMVDKAEKDGRNVYYTEKHYEQVLYCRKLQQEGLNDQFIKKMIDNESLNNTIQVNSCNIPTEKDLVLQQEAKATLNSLLSGSISSPKSQLNRSFQDSFSALGATSATQKYIDTRTTENKKIELVEQYKLSKEYPLDKEGKIFLKIEDNYELKDPEEILKKIKSILKLGE